MKLTVKKFADMCGVSVRTLHYYDEIGLLTPDLVDSENGYRYYGEQSLCRMQEILFYRELDFSLDEIARIVSSPDYDKLSALKGQKKLLLLKRKRLDRIIAEICELEKGENTVNFSAFDKSEFEKNRNAYKSEVESRWGDTEAYSEYKSKTADYTPSDWQNTADGINGIIAEFAALKAKGTPPTDSAATALAEKLQAFITATQYTCTNEILLSLADMYVADERFKSNIDKFGEGTAELISDSIKAYCDK